MPTVLHFTRYAAGSTVSAYQRGDERPIDSDAPPGRTLQSSATVAPDGSLTFDLPVGSYWAIGQVDGAWIWTAFRVNAPLEPARSDPEVHQYLYDVAIEAAAGAGGGGTGGVALEDIPNASTSTRGLTRLSTAPVDAEQPIAVGTNDARVTADQAGSASIRTIGTGSQQAAAGDHTHATLPTVGEKNALAGTNGIVGVGNEFVSTTDARMTNARTPTAHTHVIADTTSLQSTLDGKQPLAIPIEDRSTAGAYTTTLADRYKAKRYTAATAGTWTIPANVYGAGDWIEFHQAAAGQITFAAGSGLTLNSRDGWLKTAGQHAVVRVLFISATVATLAGDLAA